MLKRKNLNIIILAALVVGLLFSCTTKKNTPVTRAYHNLTSYYNAFYNAKDAFKTGEKRLMDQPGDNYAQMLNIFYYSNEKAPMVVSGEMNRVKEKASKVIKRHSITVKPKKRKKNKPEFNDLPEYTRFVDDAFLYKGIAELYSGEYFPALETFNYIIQKYSMMETKYDGQLWLARTYLEMEKFDKAKEFLDLMEGDANFPKRLKKDYYLTFADYYKKQYQFKQAAEYLDQAIPLTKNKAKKYRYHFILAQIYQELEMNDKANENYALVMKKNPIYEMIFNARINMAMLYRSTQGSPEDLKRELLKMLKDDKNKEFQDQIYFALGSIEENKGNIGEAIKLYTKSAAVSVQNNYQKTESYLAVARIYFDQPQYEKAQVYYDSAVTFIDKKRRDYEEIYRTSTNLNDLVKEIKTIQLQDSLQRVASMSENQRFALIDKIIADLIEEEKRIQEEEQMKRLAMMNQRSNNTRVNTGGGWYFYNPTTVSMGETAFKQKWGNRKLEDHWRRSDKAEISMDEVAESGEGVDSTRVTDNKKREYYLQDLPLTDSAIHVSDSLIQYAYYELGNVYRVKMENLKESAKTYEELMKRFPSFQKKLHVYYNLHKIYEELSDQINSQKYRNLVITLFPNSLYAQLMTNPEYIKKLQRQEQQAKFFYATTYRLFKSGKYQQVINNFQRADTAYAEHELHSKFALLSTISRGRLADSATFVAYLKEYVEAYPQAEEVDFAKDLLRYMSSEKELPKGVEEKKEENIADQANEEVQVEYVWEEKVPHYYISVIDTRKTSANQVKFNLSNFNIDYYSILTFNVKDFVFSANYQMISVEPFTAWYNAMNYFESIEYIKEVYEGIPKQNYIHFVISEKNYKTLFESKAINQYLNFFDENYLKRRAEEED
jgi:tetratricopeptide (TPR) repeat protein